MEYVLLRERKREKDVSDKYVRVLRYEKKNGKKDINDINVQVTTRVKHVYDLPSVLSDSVFRPFPARQLVKTSYFLNSSPHKTS